MLDPTQRLWRPRLLSASRYRSALVWLARRVLPLQLPHVVLAKGHAGDAPMTKILQDHVKQTIAPFKYPRRVLYREALPKTQTGKIQRFQLRDGK